MFSEKGMTPIDRELSKKVVKIIHGLLMMEESAAFRKPVPHKALGLQDYKMIVKKPTDLNLIRRQNNEGKYKFVEQILDEIQLCWDNCKLYNAVGSQIYNQALYLQTAFDKFGMEILPDLWIGINREEYNQKFNERKIEEEKQLKRSQIKSSAMKQEPPLLMKEESSIQKSRKNVSFQSKQFNESSEQVQSEPLSKGPEKEKQEVEEIEQGESFPREQANIDKVSMDIEEGEEGQSVAVEPIIVNLYQSPTKEQLMELSEFVKSLYAKEDFAVLQKVLQILHSNQKQNMTLNKNGLMSFRMNKIHISTYHRIKKLIGVVEESISIIE